ncbi:unnamed protein product [[Candida] boidinii]|nr:unnamed protein product [[Candida] boidinii]
MRSISTASSAPNSNFTDMSPMTTKNLSKLNSLSPSASIEKASTTSSDPRQKKKDDSSSSSSTTTTKRKVWRIKKYKDDSERQSTLIQQATQIASNKGELSRNGIRKLNVRPKINRNGEPMKFLFVDVSPQTGDRKNSNTDSESKLKNSINNDDNNNNTTHNNTNNNDSDSIGSASNSLNRNLSDIDNLSTQNRSVSSSIHSKGRDESIGADSNHSRPIPISQSNSRNQNQTQNITSPSTSILSTPSSVAASAANAVKSIACSVSSSASSILSNHYGNHHSQQQQQHQQQQQQQQQKLQQQQQQQHVYEFSAPSTAPLVADHLSRTNSG